MKIYIDLLFILNFAYDFLLLTTVSVTLKRQVKITRILIAAFVGGLSTFLIFIKINKYLLLIIKIFIGLLLTIISFKYKNFKYFLNNNIYLYMSSVILAGFLYFLKIEFNDLSYVIIILFGPVILYFYISMQKRLKKMVNYYKHTIITLKNNKVIACQGFIDTGNKMKDPVTKKYIILINKKKIKNIYNIRSPMYVPIKTINKHSLLECIAIKNIIIDNQVYTNYLLGLSDTFKGCDEYDCLLNNNILEE